MLHTIPVYVAALPWEVDNSNWWREMLYVFLLFAVCSVVRLKITALMYCCG